MENSEKIMSSEESLRVIREMIESTKKGFEKDSFHFLLWGWLVFVASLGQFILSQFNVEHSSLVWLLMPLGAIVATVYGTKQQKKEKVKTYVSEFIKYAVIAMVVSLVIVLGYMGKLQLYTYPILMLFYAAMLFITGGALQFKPLMWGGVSNWVISIIAFNCYFETQLLLLALAVLLGYIIPGHMLSRRKQA